MYAEKMDPALRALEIVRDEMVTRRVLLSIHATFGIFVGLAMVLFGAPIPFEAWFGPYSRYWFGGMAVIAGALITAGLVVGHRRTPGTILAVTGMVIHTLWQAGMVWIYTAAVRENGLMILSFGEKADPANVGRPYIAFVYLSFGLLACAHIIMLIKARPRH